MKRFLPFLLAVAALSARAAVPADFAKTFTVTVPAGLVDAGETLASFPLLLRLGTGIAGFDYADFQQSGADILVEDANGNALPFELENWDTAGESRLWVRVPSVAAGTTLTVYYGSAETVAPPAGMWSGYAGVWHLNEAGDGATNIVDSTANGQDGTSHASSKARSDGKLGAARGLELGGKNGAMTTVPSSAVLDALVPTFTVSGWVRPRTLAMNWGYLFARKTSDADPSWGLQFRASDNANTVGIYSNGSADNDDNRAVFATSGKFTANTWTKYAVVYDNTTIRLYLDGALVASKPANPGAAVNKSNGFGIGGFPTSANHSSLQADQDEVRLMNGAASAAWVAAEYRQESGAVALSYGAVGDMDATAPVVAAPVLSRDPATGAFTVTAELSARVPASVVCDADGVTNTMATADTELPMTYAATLADLAANTSYACLVAATSTGGSVTEMASPTVFYNGDLSVSKVSDAYEGGLVPGAFRISRADTAHDLTVFYTVGGTAVAGQTFAALSGTATIPEGSRFVDIAVQPLLDRQTDANTTVVLTLAAGFYGIDAVAGGAELTIVNHRFARPTDFRTKMTFTPSATILSTIGESNFSDFPVLVRLPAEASALLRSADGTDLFFTDENDAELSFEVESFDPAGETLVWVKVPSLSASTELTAYFGGAANVDNVPADVWSRYAVVVHGGDSLANAVAGGPAVSAGSSSVAANADAGRIGGGVRKSEFNAIGVNAENVASALANTGRFSVSAWFKRVSGSGKDNNGTHILAASRPGWDTGSGFVWLNEKGTYMAISAPSTHQFASGSGTLTGDAWGHAAFAYEKGVSLTTYLNGAQDNRKTSGIGNLENTSGTWTFGSYANTASGDSFKGDMDELRIFDGVASGDWIALEYATVADAAFFDQGAIEDVDSAAPFVGVPVVTRTAGVFSVSAEISTNVPASVFYDADGVTGAMATADAELPMTYSAAIFGLMEDTTYRCSVLAVSTGGSTISETCPTAFHNGDLAVAKIADADETSLAPGVFRISRADTAYDLAVAYTVGGTAVAGRAYAALSGTATIPAGSSFVDVAVTPILDAQTGADATVVLTLAAGLYGIDANMGSATLTIVNHHVAEGLDFAKKMTLTPSETVLATIGESTFADFPVLVRLPAAASAEFRTADGSDLLFTDENGTSLPFEVDTFAPAGETLVWVKVPSLSAATKLTAWFGGASNIDNDPAAVWTEYVGVWHMNEASGTIADATGHGLGASPAKATAVSVAQASGAVGTARQTATSDVKDYLSIPNYNTQNVGANFTFSCFYDATARKGYDRLVSRKETHDAGNGWEVEMANSSSKLSARGASATSISGTFSDLVSSGWMRFTFVYSGTTLTAFLNGAQIGTGTIAAATDNGKPLSIGCDSDGSEAYFVGAVDEARLRKGAASAAEVALEYATMADAAFFDAGVIKDVDVTAPFVGVPVITYAAGVFSISAEISTNVPASVFYDADGVTGAMATADAELPMTYSAAISGLMEDTTYRCSVNAVSTGGSTISETCPTAFYNGDLSVAKISDANETGLVPGSFRISRADTAYDLAVAYTVGGTAVSGRNYAALSGTATIPAGSSFVDVAVTPILDSQMDADTTVVLTLAAGLYGIDAVAESATLTIVNHHVAEGLDFAKKMTLAPSETVLATIGESTFADFPVLVRLPAEASAEFRTADGSDLVVTDENGTSLPFEVEAFDPAGTTFVWVKVPSLSASTELTVWFGGASNVDNDPTAVWSRYVGVWHYAPSEADGTSVADATGHGLTGSTTGELSTYAGPFGCDAIHSTAVVTAPDYDALVPVASQFTASGWFKLPSWAGGNGNYFYFASKKVGLNWSDANGWYVQMNQSKTKMGIVLGGNESFATIPDVSANWNHFCVVSDGTTVKVYMNGASAASISASHVIKASGTTFAISPNKTDNCADEYRIRAGAASAAETALEYATMADSTFFEQGAVEDVDPTTQKFQTPTAVRNADGTTTVTVVLRENSGDVGVIYDAGTAALTNVVATAAAPGTFTDTPANLTADTTYAFAAYGRNANGTEVVAKGDVFYNGELSIAALSNAVERGVVPGAFRVSRADAAHDLVVNLSVAGTAVAGQAYEALPTTVTIPDGATFVDVRVVPLLDHETVQDATVEVSLAPGPYGVSQAAGTATVTVENLVAPSGYNVWIAVADGLASDGANWSAGHSPTASEDVFFDGDFSAANCEWDAAASHTVASWTQHANYAGTVTFDTKYPVTEDPFQTFTVTGACVVDGGVWTHPVSVNRDNRGDVPTVAQLRAAYTYRLSVAAGSFALGAGASVDVTGKGHSQKRLSTNVAAINPAHGGKSANASVPCYGDPKYPEDVGFASNMGTDSLGKCAAGGGAIKLSVAGACVIDGTVTADGARSSGSLSAGAAGSVLIEAGSVSGTGSIFARAVNCGNNNYAHGVGGRIAVITEDPVDQSSLTVSAGAAGDFGAASGTVYYKDSGMTNGVLIVRNPGRTICDPAKNRSTDVTAEGDWTFDGLVLGGDVQLAVPYGATLRLPAWESISAPGNTVTASGLYYFGGTLDCGDAPTATLSGKWHFAPVSNYVFRANVALADGAAIGFGGKFPQRLANNAYPVDVDTIHCTVLGDLSVPAGCSVNVNKAGAMQDSNGTPSGYPQAAHGGRRSNTMATFGSVFRPRTLPHGQSNSYGHIIPGGAVELSVSGTFTLGGTVTSTGYEGGDGIVSQSAGGAIDISAGRLVGTGTITAGAIKNGQPGGRIAIRLTAAGATLGDFDGTVNCATMGAGSVGSCGSVYVETAADGAGKGLVVFDDNNVTCTTYTPICANGFTADDVADFRKADLAVRRQAKAQVTVADEKGAFRMDDIAIDETGALDLFGHVFTVTSAKVAGVNVPPGTYAAGSTFPVGNGTLGDYLVDTADGAGGTLVVRGAATVFILR